MTSAKKCAIILPLQSNTRRCGGTADALVSGSSVERRVGSNPVTCTNKRGTAPWVVPFLFIRVAGFEIGRKMRSILSVGPNSLNGCLSAKAATGGNPSPAPRAVHFCGLLFFCGAEQDRNTTARAVFLSSGFEGSPVKSHSRRFVCVYSTRLLLALLTSLHTNSRSDCFCSLTRHLHQIRTQKRIQLFVSILRFLLLLGCVFALLNINFIVCDRKSLSSESFCAHGGWALFVFVKIVGIC